MHRDCKDSGIDVSVVMATYNYGDFISKAIDSVLNQSYPRTKVEIIVIDDGSTDNTRNQIKKYGQQIRYYYQGNQGHAAALNAAVQHAQGKIIMFLDPDDYFCPNKIDTITSLYTEFNCQALFHNLLEVQLEKNRNSQQDQQVIFNRTTLADDFHDMGNCLFRSIDERVTKSLPFLATLSGQTCSRALAMKLFPIPRDIQRHVDYYLNMKVYFHEPIYYHLQPFTVRQLHQKSQMASLNKNNMEEVKISQDSLMAIINHFHQAHGQMVGNQLYQDLQYALLQAEIISQKARYGILGIFASISFRIDDHFPYACYKKIVLSLNYLLPSFYKWLRAVCLRLGIIQFRFRYLKSVRDWL